MRSSLEADSGQRHDRLVPVLLGLLITLLIAALLLSGSIPLDADFWLWLDGTPR